METESGFYEKVIEQQNTCQRARDTVNRIDCYHSYDKNAQNKYSDNI